MADSQIANTTPNQVVNIVRADKMQQMFMERLGKRAGQFTTSLISVINNNKMIAECEPMTVIQAALTAASMDLPINQNLGFAYIVPFKNNSKGITEAQFQMGWKGFVQLAQRSGQFKTIASDKVYDGDDDASILKRLTSIIAPNPPSNIVIGYVAYFELLNGFTKFIYLTKEEIEKHAGRYSQAYRSKGKSSFKSPWETDFDLMAQKTALKQLLSKYAPLSTEMQEAISADQSVQDDKGVRYIDNGDELKEELSQDQIDAINAADFDQLKEIQKGLSVELKKQAAPYVAERMKSFNG